MCLHKKHILPKISWKPITVYKVLFEEIDGDSLYTPYQDYKVSGIIIRAKYLSIFELTLEDSINGCGVHACKDLATAKEISERWLPRVIDNKRFAVAIYECTIPPFTFYWEGKDGDIAARRIKIGEKI